MTLPAGQQRLLNGVEGALQAGEPRLASMFAIFTRLTRDEELPWWEQLVTRPWLRRCLRWLAGIPRRPCGRRSRPGRSAGWVSGRPRAGSRALLLIPLALTAAMFGLIGASMSTAPACGTVHARPSQASSAVKACPDGAKSHEPYSRIWLGKPAAPA